MAGGVEAHVLRRYPDGVRDAFNMSNHVCEIFSILSDEYMDKFRRDMKNAR